MEIRIIESDFSSEQYDKKAVHPLQSWEWGEARKETGVQIVRFGEFNGSTLMDVYQMSIHRVPTTQYNIGYIPRSRYPTKAFLEFLKGYAEKHSLIFIKFEPDDTFDSVKKIGDPLLVSSPHSLFPDWTMVLDITKTENELMAAMKPKTRYNVRLAQKKEVTVREESNEAGFETFIKLYFETCKRQHYFGHNYQFHSIVWKYLKGGISHILTAYYEDIPLASYELFFFNDTLYYPYGGTSSLHRNVMAPNLLMWEAIRLGKLLGATKFDMWGSLPPDHAGDPSWEGFTRFKEGYGAEFVRKIGSYDFVIMPLHYKMYSFVYKLRSNFLKLRALIKTY